MREFLSDRKRRYALASWLIVGAQLALFVIALCCFDDDDGGGGRKRRFGPEPSGNGEPLKFPKEFLTVAAGE